MTVEQDYTVGKCVVRQHLPVNLGLRFSQPGKTILSVRPISPKICSDEVGTLCCEWSALQGSEFCWGGGAEEHCFCGTST